MPVVVITSHHDAMKDTIQS